MILFQWKHITANLTVYMCTIFLTYFIIIMKTRSNREIQLIFKSCTLLTVEQKVNYQFADHLIFQKLERLKRGIYYSEPIKQSKMI